MIVASELLDWAKLPPELRERLAYLLPLEIKDRLILGNDPPAHTLGAIHTHLAQLWKAINAMVPRWIVDSADSPDYPQICLAEATVLFADVTGFTQLTAQLEMLGPIGNEYITLALNRFFAAVVPIAIARGGDLLAFGGDAILVAFSGSDHAATAAVAAWEMQRAMASLDLGDIGLPGPLRMQMKIGLASDPLLLSSVGTVSRRVALPMGRVLDTTDAMANATAPGHVRLDARAAASAASITNLALQHDGSALLVGLHETPPWPHKHVSTQVSLSISSLATRLIALVPYLPQSVLASLIAAPQAAPGHGERRYVVNLFAHLSGLHALADALWSEEPQVVAEVADLALNRALTLIEGHGGIFARVDTYPEGHKLLALFGAPLTHEREAERAMLAALALRDAIPQLNAEIATLLAERSHGAAGMLAADRAVLKVRSGINAGPVVAGLVGSPLRWEYTVMGDAANVGARLMSKGQPGEVLVSSNVSDRVRDRLEAEARMLPIKGKPEPIPVLLVRTLYPADRSFAIQNVLLVGRTSERQALLDIGQALRSGQPHVVFVQGEAGIGKTRLVHELPALLGPDVLCVQTGSPGLVPVSFGVFRVLLAELCRTTLEFPEPPDIEELRLAVEGLCPGRGAELWPAVAVLLGLASADPVGFGATAESQQRILAWAVQSILIGAAARQPLAWICEDLHEADDASLRLFEQLLTIGWSAPVLFCATIRITAATPPIARRLVEAARGQFQSDVTSIELGGLSLDASGALLDSLLPGLAPAAREALHAHTTGNPLFLQVLAQTVRQQRMLAPSSQGLTLRGSLAALDIPRTLRELVAAQVDRLPAEVRRLAQVAAVIAVADRIVPLWLLEQIVEEPQAIAPRLRALEQAQVIGAEATAPTPHYAFRHALYQQAAYDQLLERERRELHHRLGLALHALGAGEDEGRVAALAYHCYEGQCWELAAGYCLAAGQRALRAYANRDARRLLRRALGLARRIGRGELEAEAREGLGELYGLVGRYAPAKAQLERALHHSEGSGDSPAQVEARARRHRLLALVSERTGNYDQAEAECREGMQLIGSIRNADVEIARLHVQLAEVLWRRGNFDGAEHVCRDGLVKLPEEPRTMRERVGLMVRLAHIDGQRGSYTRAIGALEQSLGAARGLADVWLVTQVLHSLGIYYLLGGQFEQSIICFTESLSVRERIGDIVGQIRTNENIGIVHQLCGNYDAALRCFHECCASCKRLNLPQSLASATGNLGYLYYIQGQLEQSFHTLHEALAIYEQLADGDGLADCLYRLGDVALAQGRAIEAYDYGVRALLHARHMESGVYEACALRVVAESLLDQGRLPEAGDWLEQARQVQERVESAYDQALLLLAFARFALAQDNQSEARNYARAALALGQALRVPYLIARAENLCQSIDS